MSALVGYTWMSLAVLIWASWLVLTSSGHTTALSILDLAGFRAIIPALMLAPLLWRHRQTVARLGVKRCLLMSAYGAPFTLCVGYGLSLAPVAHAGAMVPGLMPIFSIAIGAVFLNERLNQRQAVAVLLILSGPVAILSSSSQASASDQLWTGHVSFFLGSFFWACFTVTSRAQDLPPFLATAIVGALSTVVLAPVWMLADLSNLDIAPRADIAFQAVFQGIVSGLISVFAFSHGLRLMGAQAAALSALTPGVAALLAIPVLGQVPSAVDVFALVLVVTGLIIRASGRKDIPGKVGASVQATPPVQPRKSRLR